MNKSSKYRIAALVITVLLIGVALLSIDVKTFSPSHLIEKDKALAERPARDQKTLSPANDPSRLAPGKGGSLLNSDTSASVTSTTPLNVRLIAEGLLATRNPATNLMPSHYGHPGYENLGFLYDLSVAAIILNAAGYKADAEAMLDYFARRLDVPLEEVMTTVDTNGVFGILKVLEYNGPAGNRTKALVNAIDVSATSSQGKGLLEFYTTPGPMAFFIFAMLQTDAEKYKKTALELGETLLSMQEEDGGIRDGDRAPDRVHTEPNMDCFAAFMMLYEVSGQQKWLIAADKAFEWFSKKAYDKENNAIHQGIWRERPSRIFATDVYSWTMAGPAGDRLSPEELRQLTEKMLTNCIVKVSLELPDSSRKTVILADFSKADDSRVVNARHGMHPMGTIEWTGGVILALQKNAVRLWKAGDRKTAKQYKALAHLLLKETSLCFYRLDKPDIVMTFYATAQGVEIAPFGAIQNKSTNGWKTTYYYVKDADGKPSVKGGAMIGAWVLLPYLGVNPFILHDSYKASYDAIPIDASDVVNAAKALNDIATGRTYTEEAQEKKPDRRVQIVEPRMFNKMMWKAIEDGYQAKSGSNTVGAKRSFTEAISWATKVVQNPVWMGLARADNETKQKEVGGIIYYPWGTVYPNNEHPVHFAIQRYPLLNEVGTAAWALATASYELGQKEQAKLWMGKIIDEFPLHQIAAVQDDKPDLILGYWNALVSWEERSLGMKADPGIYNLYKEVLSEKGIPSAKPPTVVLFGKEKEMRPDMSGPPEPLPPPMVDKEKADNSTE